MPDTVIDTLTIKVQGDGQSAVETLDKVAKALEKIKSVSVGNTGNVTKRLNSLRDSINSINSKSLSKLNSLFNAINSLKQAAIPKSLVERIAEVGQAVKSLQGIDFTQLNRMADGLRALSKVQNVKLPNVKGKNAQAILNALGEVQGGFGGTVETPVTETTVKETKSFSDVLSGVKDKLKSIATRAVEVGKNVKSAFSNTIIGRFASKLSETLRAFKRIAIYRFIRTVIKSITEGFKTGIDNMYQYSKTFNGEYARNMDTLASANLTFKNSLGAIIAPLINLVTPWLDKLVTKLYEINNTIAMVIAGLTGKSTYSKAVRVATEYAAAADNASKSTSKVKEKVDELKRSLAGIDEITIIGDLPSSPAANTGVADTAKNSNVPDYSTMFVEAPVDMEKIAKVRDILNKVLDLVKLIGLGLLAWNIAKFLGELGLLKGALSKLEFATGLTLSIIGVKLIWDSIKSIFNEGLNWDNFWKLLLGDSFLTAGFTLLGHSFSKGTGAKLGFKLGLAITGITLSFAGISDALKRDRNAATAAENFKNGLKDLFTSTLGGAALGTAILPGWGTLIGAAVGLVADGVVEIVKNWDDLKTTFDLFVNGSLSKFARLAMPKFFKDLGFDEETSKNLTDFTANLYTAGENVIGFFKNIGSEIGNFFSGIPDFFSGIGKSIGSFFSGLGSNIADFFTSSWNAIKDVWGSVTSWFDTNVIQPITGFFTGLWEGISKGVEDIAIIIEAVWITVTTWIDENVIQPISSFFSGLWQNIQSIWINVANWFNTNVIQPIVNFFSPAIEAVKNFFIGLWNNIKGIWNNVATWFSTNVITPVVNFFSNAVDNIKNFFTNLWGNIKNIWSNVSNWFNTTVIQPVVNFFSTAIDKIKGFFSGLWDGIKKAGINTINSLAGTVENIINGVIDSINFFIEKFNSVGKWASGVTGRDFNFVNEIQHISVPRMYAEGGFPEDGLFFANHNELVGQFSNGKTAVANNGQIVEGISQGVESANEEQNSLLREQSRLLRMLLEKRSTIDVTTITNAMSRKNQRDGKVTVPVAT